MRSGNGLNHLPEFAPPADGLSDLERRVLAAKAAGESTCLGCGCTDSAACAGGCTWVLVDPRRGIGVCSACEVRPVSWLLP